MVGFISVSLAAFIGITLGVIAGYFGKVTGLVIMRFIDTMMPFPLILLALLIAALLGGGMKNLIISLAIAPYRLTPAS